MTYDEVIIAFNKESRRLKGCSVRLFLHLYATAIEKRSNEVSASYRDLAESLGIAKESVAEGARELARLIRVGAAQRGIRTYTLPPALFPPQMEMFAGPRPVENWPDWPGNQDTTGLETRTVGRKTRTLLAWKPGQSGEKPGQSGEKPGHYWPGNQDSRNHR